MPTIALVRGGRIIPALAGNTDEIRLIQLHNGDHPRSRGEYFVRQSLNLRIAGSSPLSRGIRGMRNHLPGVGGIIPALAGNTQSLEGDCEQQPDHPRSRGEYSPTLAIAR